jgi:hypothetical protein
MRGVWAHADEFSGWPQSTTRLTGPPKTPRRSWPVERSKPFRHRFPGDVRRCNAYLCRYGGPERFRSWSRIAALSLRDRAGEAAKCSGRTGVVNDISNAAGRLLTQIDFVARREPEIMIGLCVGVEPRPANRLWFETSESSPRHRIRLSARSQLKAQGKKARFSHTLCTCGADASRAECGYPIGVRRFFSVEHCLHMRKKRRRPAV